MRINSLTKIMLFSLLLVLAGFSARERVFLLDAETDAEKEKTIVNVVSPEEKPVLSFVDAGTMKASWYGPGFHGRKTASGETYNQEEYTAAHKTYRFGTLLRLTNPKNGKSVVVRVNDRGPYVAGRALDISRSAARALDMHRAGTGKLMVEQITLRGVNFPVIPFE